MSVIPQERIAAKLALAGNTTARADLYRMFGKRVNRAFDTEPGRGIAGRWTTAMVGLANSVRAFMQDGTADTADAVATAAQEYAQSRRALDAFVRSFAADACESLTGERLDLPPMA